MNAPERAIPDGIETYHPQQSQRTSIFIQPDSASYQPVSSTGAEKYPKSQFEIGPEGAKQDPHRIGGFRRRWFWLLIALIAVVVIGASVGGAVGGTHANKSSDSGAASCVWSFLCGAIAANEIQVYNVRILNSNRNNQLSLCQR